jgi:hypothetical protein
MRYTISEEARTDLLDRLLALNHARYAAEGGGKERGTGRRKKKG